MCSLVLKVVNIGVVSCYSSSELWSLDLQRRKFGVRIDIVFILLLLPFSEPKVPNQTLGSCDPEVVSFFFSFVQRSAKKLVR